LLFQTFIRGVHLSSVNQKNARGETFFTKYLFIACCMLLILANLNFGAAKFLPCEDFYIKE
jgi:hypothetical protein